MSPVRTLLVSEIAHRDRLAREHSDARMAEVWRAHDRAVRDLLPRFHGVEADRTDGFLLLFEAVDHAVAFADQLHAAMADLAQRFHLPFAARVGVHQGPVVLIETSPQDRARGAKPLEVEGLAKPTAARIMSVARPGQTLLSADARATLTGPWRAVSHGFWTLKGVAEPVELFQAAPPDGVFLPPPDGHKVRRVVPRDGHFVPLAEVPHHLPAERDPFVGRQHALQALADALASHPLVTVTGPAGTGKTRLVTRFAWTFRGAWPGGVWFCDLAEARDLPGVVAAVAGALDVPLGATEPVEHLGRVLAHRGELLLLLDNFEQVAHLAADTVARWRQMAPEARLLVTSRARLGLPDEHPLPLSPLDPDEAVALFTQRAQAAVPDFRLTDDNRPQVEALARLLDGLPLAIELAAARVRLLSPRAILDRMDQRFRLLARPGAPRSRQDTLRGALDWSWDLLGPDEQAALAQLSVFEGGFTLPAAEAVLAPTDLGPAQAVTDLVDQSLVQRTAPDRLALLVSVQAYAAERLDALGLRAQAEARHGRHFARLGEVDAVHSLRARGGEARKRARLPEVDNLRIAHERAVARRDLQIAGPIALALHELLVGRGPLDIPFRALQAALDLEPHTTALHARLLCAYASVCSATGRKAEREASQQAALELSIAVGDRRTEGAARARLAVWAIQTRHLEEAANQLKAALRVCEAVGDPILLGVVRAYQGQLARVQGRFEEAQEHLEAALAVHQEESSVLYQATTLDSMGLLWQVTGEIERAMEAFHAALALHLDCGNPPTGAALSRLGLMHLNRGDLEEARPYLERALRIHREAGAQMKESIDLTALGNLHHIAGDTELGIHYYEQALAMQGDLPDWAALTRAHLAAAMLDCGKPTEAERHAKEALDRIDQVRDPAIRGVLHAMHAHALHHLGRFDQVGAALAKAEAILRNAPRSSYWIVFLSVRAICTAASDPQAARADLEAAIALRDQLGLPAQVDASMGIADARRALAEAERRD